MAVRNLTDEQLEARIAMMEAMIAHAHPKNLPAYNQTIQKLMEEQVRRDMERETQPAKGDHS